MMTEGESSTTGGVVRLPDEETTFVRRKVKAPRRRQKQRAERRRLAVLAVTAVTVLAFGAVGVFLTVPSSASEEVQTAVSQAMASDADQVFVPSFEAYDEDGDGNVSLGEYLDRMAINRDAALEKVDASSLNETEKARIRDLLDEDFSKHSDCVAKVAQEHDGELMTKENFDDVYEEITTAFCPLGDDRIPDSYQPKETAAGQAPIEEDPEVANPELSDGSEEVASGSASAAASKNDQAEEAAWNPDKPTPPPRPVSSDDAKTKKDLSGSEPTEDKQWTPSFPSDPPVVSSIEIMPWTPNDAIDPPANATNGEAKWRPNEPTDPASVDKKWEPNEPVTVSSSSDTANGAYMAFKGGNTAAYRAASQSNPKAASEMQGERPTGAYPHNAANTYTGTANMGAYGAFKSGDTAYGAASQSNPKAASEMQGERPTGAYPHNAANTYTDAANTGTANMGAYGAFKSGDTAYGAASQSNPKAASEMQGERPTGAYPHNAANTYTDTANMGAYGAFKSGDTAYGAASQSNPKAASEMQGERPTGAYPHNAANTYTDTANMGAYGAFKSGDTAYGAASQSNPKAASEMQGERPTGAYPHNAANTYTDAADTGTANMGAYGAFKSGDTAHGAASQSNPKAASEMQGERPTGAYPHNAANTGTTNTAYGVFKGGETGAYAATPAHQGGY